MAVPRPGRRGRMALSLALALVVVAVPVGIFAWGRTLPAFTVKRVVVTGQDRIPSKEVTRLLETRFEGENLFSVSATDVRKTLSVYPYLADVRIDRDFPETLRVRLTEYVPAALLFADGAWYVVSREGRVLAELVPKVSGDAGKASPSPGESASGRPDEKSSPAPVSTVATPAATPSAEASSRPAVSRAGPLPRPPAAVIPRGMRALPVMASEMPVTVGSDVSDDAVNTGLAVLTALPSQTRRQVVAVVATAVSVKVYLARDVEVEFGDASRLPDKVLALRAVLSRYEQRHVEPRFVDVSVPGRPLGAPLLPTPKASP